MVLTCIGNDVGEREVGAGGEGRQRQAVEVDGFVAKGKEKGWSGGPHRCQR